MTNKTSTVKCMCLGNTVQNSCEIWWYESAVFGMVVNVWEY